MEEFRKVMVNEGAQMTDAEIDEIIHEVDLDGDGQLNIDGVSSLLKLTPLGVSLQHNKNIYQNKNTK